jgi:hypothetical protein
VTHFALLSSPVGTLRTVYPKHETSESDESMERSVSFSFTFRLRWVLDEHNSGGSRIGMTPGGDHPAPTKAFVHFFASRFTEGVKLCQTVYPTMHETFTRCVSTFFFAVGTLRTVYPKHETSDLEDWACKCDFCLLSPLVGTLRTVYPKHETSEIGTSRCNGFSQAPWPLWDLPTRVLGERTSGRPWV